MKAIEASNFNCYKLSSTNDNDIVDWSMSGNASEIITTWLYPTIFLKYNQFNITDYQWCGVMLFITEYFAKFTKTR